MRNNPDGEHAEDHRVNVDTACVFFKEIVLQFHLPAELRVSATGDISILVHRAGIIEQVQHDIERAAENRGFRNNGDIHWMKFDG
jgi:hypothetical protein